MAKFKTPKLLIFKIGHSKSDPGAVAPDTTTPEPNDIIKEFQLNFGIAMKIGTLNVPTVIINDDEDFNVGSATKAINTIVTERGLTWQDVILISIHCDFSGAPSGAFSYYLGNSGGVDESKALESKRLSGIMVAKVSGKIGYPNRGIKPDTSSRFGRLGILRDTIPLAILLESGSMGADLDILKNKNGQIAEAIIEAIEEFSEEKISSLSIKDHLERIVQIQKDIWALADTNGNPQSIKINANRSADTVRIIQKALGLPISG